MRLAWDIVHLIRIGQKAAAIQTLAAQRRISLDEARKTVRAWCQEHMPETLS